VTTLITGGAGFIGSRLALALRKQSERLVLLDNFNSYYDPQLKRDNAAEFAGDSAVTVIEGDVRDKSLIDAVMAGHEVERIVHLAAMAGVRNSVNEAHLYFEVNLMGTLNMMEAARQYGVKQFVQAYGPFVSSSVRAEHYLLAFFQCLRSTGTPRYDADEGLGSGTTRQASDVVQ
jgi:UDP-glucuronate 4-epimerase